MKIHANKATIPNPLLEPFSVLIGEWETIGSHPYLPDVLLHGQTSFNWIEGGSFLIMHSENSEGKIPSGIAVFGSDNASGKIYMLYFDERKVSRKYEVLMEGNVLTWWRNDPDFSQRFSWAITDDYNTIVAEGEMRKDGIWQKDLESTLKRIK